MNKVLESVVEFWKRFVTISYSTIMKHRFSVWGSGSRITPPATLNRPWLIDVGDRVRIREHAWLNVNGEREDGRATLVIGSGTYIGRFVQINANSDIVIGPDVLISDRVYVSDVGHSFADLDLPIIKQGVEEKGPVRLCSGCWIGIGAVILPGVVIGKNAVIAANAVVTRDVADFTVVGGVPAEFIRNIHDSPKNTQ